MHKEADFLAGVVTDYVNLLEKEGHHMAAKLVTSHANRAVSSIKSSSSTPVPESEENADRQNP